MSVDLSGLFNYSSSSSTSTGVNGIDLNSYASIKNGSYGKLMKAYYKQMDEEEAASSGDSSSKLTSIKSNADALKSATEALNSSSLWEKKTVTSVDEETGEETTTEDYDWDAITSAVNKFVDAYNGVVSSTGESDTKDVLRSASWLVSLTDKNSNLLSSVGIEIGSDNKLSVDESALKSSNVSTLKLLFSGQSSFADEVGTKATSISRSAAKTSTTYTKNGTWSNTISNLANTVNGSSSDDSSSTDITT